MSLANLPWMQIGVAALMAAGGAGGGYYAGSPSDPKPTTVSCEKVKITVPVEVYLEGKKINPR